VILFAKVESVFQISGRGTVIVPAFLSEILVRVGSQIQLRVPDGKVKDTHITAVEFLSDLGTSRLAFMLPRDVAQRDVPEGTEIWLAEIQEQQATL
jgi:translation elongation factor EF-Tu-like GTPase